MLPREDGCASIPKVMGLPSGTWDSGGGGGGPTRCHNTQELRQENHHKFKASLNYKMKPCLKNKMI
jgi:hypothetical protein